MVGMERIGQRQKVLTARQMGLVACSRCQQVWEKEVQTCGRCGHKLASRAPHSLQRVWAYWLIGLMCYIPANIYPMLQTRTLFFTQQDTIIGGAIELIEYGSYAVALIILFASVVIPIGKFLAIAFLAISVQRPTSVSHHQRQMLHEVVDYIGRWSMIDIFVVAILSSLVQLKVLVSIYPGPASLFFALTVIFTMISAQAFDSRLIWDEANGEQESKADD
ncbi:MAG: paraquat-inducible protein A [Pseudomonadota bacterium]